MAEATQEMIALAREIAANTHDVAALRGYYLDGTRDSTSQVRIALAAIQATTELAAEWLDRLSTELVTPDFLTFVGDPFGQDGQALCGDIAMRLRAAAHLKEQPA